MASSIESVFMVEASSELRAAQKKLLCAPDATFAESEVGQTSSDKYGGKPIIWSDSIKSIPIGQCHLLELISRIPLADRRPVE